MEIKVDSESKNQLNRIRKSPLLLIQEESLAKKFTKYPCQFEKSQKTYKEREDFQNFPYPKLLLSFHVLTTFFSKF